MWAPVIRFQHIWQNLPGDDDGHYLSSMLHSAQTMNSFMKRMIKTYLLYKDLQLVAQFLNLLFPCLGISEGKCFPTETLH